MGKSVIAQVRRTGFVDDNYEPAPEGRGSYVLTATAELHSLDGQPPYFAVTADVNVRHPGGRLGRLEACGAMHEPIVRMFPDLVPLVALHLSDANGVPLHAVENGWYWAGGTEWNGSTSPGSPTPPNAPILASYLRIPGDEAERLVAAVTEKRMNKLEFTAFVEAQKPRWRDEAVAALDFLRSGAWPEPPASGPRP